MSRVGTPSNGPMIETHYSRVINELYLESNLHNTDVPLGTLNR